MESAGLRLHNSLNPAEIQVSLKGTGWRHPSRQACLVKQVRSGAAECGPPPVPRAPQCCRRTANAPRKTGEQTARVMGIPLSPGAQT